MKNAAEKNSLIIKKLAKDVGFDFCGISKADFLKEDALKLEQWLKNGYNGTMKWMENHFEKRLDPRILVPGAKTVISLMYNYYTDKNQLNSGVPIVSKYAFGRDYHDVIKDKLNLLFGKIKNEIGNTEGRVFTDSAPVMERAWATRSGLGWIGKNTMLINKKKGSFYFLAEIICDLELQADHNEKDYCGSCTACIDSCPTQAILPGKIIDANRCISYLTIEYKDEINNEFKGHFENRVFGCDICQDVCPWNRFSTKHNELAFEPSNDFLNLSKEEWSEMNEDFFKIIFKNSAVKRTKYKGFKRNIEFLK